MNISEVREEIRSQNLDIFGVCELLDEYGSGDDPIIWKGEEMQARDLAYKLAQATPALEPRISFWGTLPDGKFGLRRNSNFAHMVLDRMRFFEERTKKERKETLRKQRGGVVEYIVSWDEWLGIEPCGRTEWKRHTKRFKQDQRPEAKACFVDAKRRYNNVEFRQVTSKLLGSSDD